jgi:hypothetical protein
MYEDGGSTVDGGSAVFAPPAPMLPGIVALRMIRVAAAVHAAAALFSSASLSISLSFECPRLLALLHMVPKSFHSNRSTCSLSSETTASRSSPRRSVSRTLDKSTESAMARSTRDLRRGDDSKYLLPLLVICDRFDSDLYLPRRDDLHI